MTKECSNNQMTKPVSRAFELWASFVIMVWSLVIPPAAWSGISPPAKQRRLAVFDIIPSDD
jgi:hypothetical protein